MNEDYSAIVGYSLWSTSVEVGVMSAIGKLGDLIVNDWHWIVFPPPSVGVFKLCNRDRPAQPAAITPQMLRLGRETSDKRITFMF